jgi:hypothetical protein
MMTNGSTDEAHEEVEDGVEPEEVDGERSAIRPWDPTQIRINTKSYSLRQIVDEIKDGTINLAPDFQRAYVWKEKQQSQLIESILLGIPLPTFYFSADADGTMNVVDGVQRLTTIARFANDGFALDSIEYIDQLRETKFSKMDPSWRRRFHSTQILVHVIEPQTPSEVKYDIFRRINTGGTPLTAQQIRHCMSRPRSRTLLSRMIGSEEFHRATRSAFREDVEMTGRELALRFIAFSEDFDIAKYSEHETLDDFLMHVTRRIDDPKEFSEERLVAIEARFVAAMRRAWLLFEDKAFRRWAKGGQRAGRLNRALFDSWAVALSEVDDDTIKKKKRAIVAAVREAMRDDEEYKNSFAVGTGDPRRVAYRLKKARALLAVGAEA